MTKVIQTGEDIIKVSTNWLGRELSFEVNKVGFRTSATVVVRYGDTVVLGMVNSGDVNPNLDYFPLSIDYEEKYYASGKISSSRFIKREGKPSDEAVLVGRLIDRPIRPLFPKGYRNECQVVTTVLSMDPSFRPDAVAMLAASAATVAENAIHSSRVGFVMVTSVTPSSVSPICRWYMFSSCALLAMAMTAAFFTAFP